HRPRGLGILSANFFDYQMLWFYLSPTTSAGLFLCRFTVTSINRYSEAALTTSPPTEPVALCYISCAGEQQVAHILAVRLFLRLRISVMGQQMERLTHSFAEYRALSTGYCRDSSRAGYSGFGATFSLTFAPSGKDRVCIARSALNSIPSKGLPAQRFSILYSPP